MATKKPLKRGSSGIPPEPPNPRAEPDCFIVRGKAWFDEYGEMLIDEDGNVPGWIEDDLDLERFGDCLYDETHFRNDGTPRAGQRVFYELRWCPVPKQKAKAKSRKR